MILENKLVQENKEKDPHYESFYVFRSRFDILKRYKIEAPIGQGGFGVVCRAYNIRTGEKIAIKKIINAFNNPIDAKRLIREIRIMKYFTHENIISLKDILNPLPKKSFNDVYLVTELMDTDLHQIIASDQIISDDHVQYFMYQIMCAVKYIHSANVLHRDLKPNNILVNKDCTIKVCDFGLSRPVGSQNHKLEFMTNNISTIWYRAPELLLTWKEYTKAIDMWAVGCILAELLKRKPLLPGRNHLHQVALILKLVGSPSEEEIDTIQNAHAKTFIKKLPPTKPIDIDKIFPGCSKLAIDLLSKLLKFNPKDRLTVEEALDHPFFEDIRNKALETSTNIELNYDFEKAIEQVELKTMIYDEMTSYYPDMNEKECHMPSAKDEELLTLDLDGSFIFLEHKKQRANVITLNLKNLQQQQLLPKKQFQ